MLNYRLLLVAGWMVLALGGSLAAPEVDLPAEVTARLNERVNQELAPLVRRACEQLRVTYPPTPPTLSLIEVQQEIAKAVDVAVEREFPADREEAIRAEAAELYAPLKQGDDVTVTLTSGRRVTGKVYQINQYFVQVSDQRISKRDLAPDSLARYDAASSATAQEAHVRRQLLRSTAQEDRLRREKEEELGPPIYVKHGYRKFRDQWMPIVDLIDAALAQRRQELQAEHRAWAENQVYMSRGYAQVEGEWRLLDKALEERRQAERSSATPTPTPETFPTPAPQPVPPVPALPPAEVKAPEGAEFGDPALPEPPTHAAMALPQEQEGMLEHAPMPATGEVEDPFADVAVEAAERPEVPVRQIGDGFGEAGAVVDVDQLGEAGDDADLGELSGVMRLVISLVIYIALSFVATLALWFGGMLMGTETSLVHCLLAAALSQALPAVFMLSLWASLAATGINFGVLWYTNRSAGTGRLIAQVLVANVLAKLIGMAVLFLVFMALAGAMFGALGG